MANKTTDAELPPSAITKTSTNSLQHISTAFEKVQALQKTRWKLYLWTFNDVKHFLTEMPIWIFLLPINFFINQSTHGNSLCGTTQGSPHQHKTFQNYHLGFATGMPMLLYRKLRRWTDIALANQYAIADTNIISLPLFFPQILPTFTTGYCSVNQRKEKGLLLYCCHLCAFAFRALFFQILKYKHILEAKPKLQAPALTAKYTSESTEPL